MVWYMHFPLVTIASTLRDLLSALLFQLFSNKKEQEEWRMTISSRIIDSRQWFSFWVKFRVAINAFICLLLVCLNPIDSAQLSVLWLLSSEWFFGVMSFCGYVILSIYSCIICGFCSYYRSTALVNHVAHFYSNGWVGNIMSVAENNSDIGP